LETCPSYRVCCVLAYSVHFYNLVIFKQTCLDLIITIRLLFVLHGVRPPNGNREIRKRSWKNPQTRV